MRRVVVTGLGAITPLGVGQYSNFLTIPRLSITTHLLPTSGIRRTWKKLIEGHCGVQSTTHLGPQFGSIPSQVAALVPVDRGQNGGWKASDWLTKDVRVCTID